MSWINHIWQLGATAFFAGWNAIAFSIAPAFAQSNIVPDNTLGVEKSEVVPLDSSGFATDVIIGGAVRGSNLFHSFREFNVSEGREAYFFNQSNTIQNILARVTGTNRSEIFGKLGILNARGITSNPNLFLINPNGIVFGENAQLDVSGSFIATTASSVKFADGNEFSTTPQSTSLLTISVPLGLQFGASQGSIQAKGDGQGIRTTGDLIDTTTGLRVPPNQTLALVGGDINLSGATLKTAGGRIELGSVTGKDLVTLNTTDKGFLFGYDGVKNFGNIQMMQQSSVDASGEGAGDVQVVGRRVSLASGSIIESSTLRAKPGGNLVINARELLEMSGVTNDGVYGSGLYSFVYGRATGSGGNITANTNNLLIKDRGFIGTNVIGSGKGGNLTINASGNVQVVGAGSGIFSEVKDNTIGQGGNLTITAQNLLISDGAQVNSSTFGAGNAGDINVKVANSINLFDRRKPDNYEEPGGLIALTLGGGNSGNITINTGRLSIQDGSIINANTYGFKESFLSGNAKGGNLNINASDSIEISGKSFDGKFKSRISSETGRWFNLINPNSKATGGDINITTQRLTLGERNLISSKTYGSGNAGKLNIIADHILIEKGDITASVEEGSNGRAGDVNISASDSINIIGSGGIFSQSVLESKGTSGSMSINTQRLTLDNNAFILTSAFGEGNAGKLDIKASDFIEARASSLIGSPTFSIGNGGDLTIETGRLFMSDSVITTYTNGKGNAGNLFINAFTEITGEDSSITTQAYRGSIGNAGNLYINTPKFTLSKNSELLTTTSGFGNSGDLTIKTGRLIIQDASQVATATSSNSRGNGGNLAITASESVEVLGKIEEVPSGIATATTGSGNAGRMKIETGKLLVQDGAAISTRTSENGNAGDISIQANSIFFKNGSFLQSNSGGEGKPGNISINFQDKLWLDNAFIESSSKQTEGGNINITGNDVKLVRSRIFTSTFFQEFTSGYMNLNFRDLNMIDDSNITTLSLSGSGGNINLNARDVRIAGNSDISTIAPIKSGDIALNVRDLEITSKGAINTTSPILGTIAGTGGDIGINARNIQMSNGSITTSSLGRDIFNRGGNITIKSEDFRLRNSSLLGTFSLSSGGNITVDSDKFIAIEDSDILANAVFRTGGNITINSKIFLADIFASIKSNSNDFLTSFRNNGRVDISATSLQGVNGAISVPSFDFIENSLTELPTNTIDTNTLIANSCIVRRNQSQEGTFLITGTGALPPQTGDNLASMYATGTVRNISNPSQTWKKGDPIVEPQGVYQLTDGRLVMSREC